MRSRVLSVLSLALVTVVFAGGAASGATAPEPPYESDAECLACHDAALGGAALSGVDFGDTVDYSACARCHWVSEGTPYILDHAKVLYLPDCTSCHYQMPFARPWAGQASTPYGYFASAASPSASPADVHAAHVNGSWPQGGSSVDCDEYCRSCHGATGCSTCHTASLADGGHGAHVASADEALPEYAPVAYATATGVSPTPAAVSTVNQSYTTVPCAASGCHPRATLLSAPVPACSSCHAAKTSEHGYGVIDHGADDGTLEGTACSACHTLDLAGAHGDAGADGASCMTCHPAPRDTVGGWDQSCVTGACHAADSAAPMHAGTAEAHVVLSANTLCLGCHAGTDLGSVHAGAVDENGKTSCLVCHTGTIGEPATNDCTVCHFDFTEHYGSQRHTSSWAPLLGCSGAGCHDVSGDLMTVHEEHRTAEEGPFGCAGCHSDFAYADEIATGLTGCGDCHADIYETSSHADVHAMTPSLADGVYAYGSDDGTNTPVTDCAGCHLSNLVYEHMGLVSLGRLPRYTTDGVALGCDTCHASADPAVAEAISAGSLGCTGCHDVHEPQTAAHESTFMVEPQVDCSKCHSDQLETEHSGDLTVVTPSTHTLTGCAICHEYWTTDGPLGVTVQEVIEGDDRTMCTDCHASTHPDLGSHVVSTSASQACAACHDEGGTVSIDVKAIHVGADRGPCAVCHDNAERVGDISALTAGCASCHATDGVTYHRALPSAHVFAAMDVSCVGAGCHVASALPEEHERFLAGSGFEMVCALCHGNSALDITGKTADCSSCHSVHGDIATVHTGVESQSCVDCHETGDVLVVHQTPAGEPDCALCHAAASGRIDWASATVECAACHAAVQPIETQHYPMAAHAAYAERGCPNCHSMDLKTEHFKPTVAVGCVDCHESSVDALTGPWDKTCDACHPTRHQDRVGSARR